MGDFLGEMADMMSQATPTVKPPPLMIWSRPSRVEIRALTELMPTCAGDLRGAAAGVRGHVPGRPGRRRLLRRASDDGPQGPGTQHLAAAVGVVVAVAADACRWKKQGSASDAVVVV